MAAWCAIIESIELDSATCPSWSPSRQVFLIEWVIQGHHRSCNYRREFWCAKQTTCLQKCYAIHTALAYFTEVSMCSEAPHAQAQENSAILHRMHTVVCCGFLSVMHGHRFRNLCHQSFRGISSVNGFGKEFSCRYTSHHLTSQAKPMSVRVMRATAISCSSVMDSAVGLPAPTFENLIDDRVRNAELVCHWMHAGSHTDVSKNIPEVLYCVWLLFGYFFTQNLAHYFEYWEFIGPLM